MNIKMLGSKGSGRNDFLYAMLWIAGITATIFSMIGIAMITDLIPHAHSNSAQHWESVPAPSMLVFAEPSFLDATRVAVRACDNCDGVRSVEAMGRVSRFGLGPSVKAMAG
jgi:hypothetical protein